MENPKNSQRLQRHSTLPPRLQRHATLRQRLQRRSSLRPFSPGPRLPNKSNPYVGWFRHAPDTSFLQEYRLSGKRSRRFTSSLQDVKNSPYVGWFRHAPPSRVHLRKDKLVGLDQEFNALFKIMSKAEFESMNASTLVCGHLKGGAPGPRRIDHDEYQAFRRSLQDSAESTPSATVKVLTRLASWFLFPLAHDADSCGYRHGDKVGSDAVLPQLLPSSIRHAILEEDECSSDSSCNDSDDDSSVDTISNDRPSDLPNEVNVAVSVSSLAEAYYSHQAEKEVDQSAYAVEGEEGQRLDYVITQMDIARMARNASRHLDVASILSLPTITYHQSDSQSVDSPPSSQQQQQQETNPNDPGWSWMIVHDGIKPDEQVSSKDEDDIDVCVICLEHFVDGDRLRVLPCDHSFHVGCIDRWLSGSHSFDDCITSGCPTCKKRADPPTDGSVPAWAFTRIGESLAKNSVATL